MVSCIDFANSEKSGAGKSILKATFLQEANLDHAVMFKDPLTANGRIYLTAGAKQVLETMIAKHSLTGLQFFEAGKAF